MSVNDNGKVPDITIPGSLLLDLLDGLPKGLLPEGADPGPMALQFVQEAEKAEGTYNEDLYRVIAYLLWKKGISEQYIEPTIHENEMLKRRVSHLTEMVTAWEESKGREASGPSQPYKPMWYSWSVDEERYEGFFATREEAVAEAVAERATEYDYAVGDTMTVWTGLCVAPNMATEVERTLDPEWVLDNLQDNLYDEAGEFAEDAFEGVSLAAKDDLGKSLTRTFLWWMSKHECWPTYFTVEETQEHHHELTAEDLGEEEETDV